MSATTAAQSVKFYSEKSKAKRALKAIGDKALAASETLLVAEDNSKRWGFVVADAEAAQAGVDHANNEWSAKKLAEVSATVLADSGPAVSPATLMAEVAQTGASQVLADEVGNEDPTDAEIDESNEEETHKPVMNGGFASMLGQMMGQSVAPADAQSPSKKKAAPKVTTGQKIEKDRPMQNGVKRPSVGGMCRAVWDALDGMVAAGTAPTAKDVKALSETHEWNANNASIEFYQWRKFNGIKGRQVKA